MGHWRGSENRFGAQRKQNGQAAAQRNHRLQESRSRSEKGDVWPISSRATSSRQKPPRSLPSTERGVSGAPFGRVFIIRDLLARCLFAAFPRVCLPPPRPCHRPRREFVSVIFCCYLHESGRRLCVCVTDLCKEKNPRERPAAAMDFTECRCRRTREVRARPRIP